MTLPNAVRTILLLLTIASFVPQYMRIFTRRDCNGLSGFYLLFNLIAATQQFSVGLTYILFLSDGDDILVHNPPSLGDWLNMSQLGIVFVGHLILFGGYLFFPHESPGEKNTVASLFFTFLLVPLVPVIFLVLLPAEGGVEHDRSWPLALFIFFSSYVLNPVATVLAVAAYLPQARELRSDSDIGALSVLGLLVQACVFLVVGTTWDSRWVVPHGLSGFTWYDFGGWALIDNVIFSLVQGALWWIARGFERNGPWAGAVETEPLAGRAR